MLASYLPTTCMTHNIGTASDQATPTAPLPFQVLDKQEDSSSYTEAAVIACDINGRVIVFVASY